MAARTSRLDSASESATTADLDGAGTIGDLIGAVDTRCITTTGTTPEATHSTTEAIFTEEGHGVDTTADAAELTSDAVE
jgi:hypothetical protein